MTSRSDPSAARKAGQASPAIAENARVEFYAGYRGQETPRTVVIDGARLAIESVLSRKRTLDRTSGLRRDVWRCRLADGRKVTVELLEGGSGRAYLSF